jgi:hypothetical protein
MLRIIIYYLFCLWICQSQAHSFYKETTYNSPVKNSVIEQSIDDFNTRSSILLHNIAYHDITKETRSLEQIWKIAVQEDCFLVHNVGIVFISFKNVCSKC